MTITGGADLQVGPQRAGLKAGSSVVAAAVVLCAAILHAQAPAARDTAAISGRVVDGATGAPLEGVVVTLLKGIASQQAVGRQATDRAGRFVFASVPSATPYQLKAAKPGYFDGSGRRVTPTAGEWLRDREIRIWKPATISGTVRDERGAPVVGAYVAVLARIFAAGIPNFASGPYAKTDDHGEYHIAPLPPGTYLVVVPSSHSTVPDDTPRPGVTSVHALLPLPGAGFQVIAPGSPIGPARSADGRRLAYPTTFHPQAQSLASATVVEVVSGDDRTGVDLQLQPVPVFRVSGRLEGPPDAVANRRVRLVAAGSEEVGIGHEAAIALTTADGSFTFVDIPDGAYTILAASGATGYDLHPQGAVTAPLLDAAESLALPFGLRSTFGSLAAATAILRGRAAGSDASIRAFTFSLNRNDAFVARMPIAVSGADQAGIVVPLQQGVSVAGRFVMDARDRAALSAIIPYLEVAAQSAGAEPSLREVRGGVVPSAPVLDFVIKDVLPGDYLFRVVGNGPMTKAITLGGRDYTGLPLTVTDRGLSGLVVTVTSEVAQVQGMVRNAQGRPATDAAVIHFPADPSRWRRFGPQPERLQSVLVEPDGRFSIIKMPAGDYFFVAVEEAMADRWRDPDFLEAAAQSATRISVGWGETRVQNLPLSTVTW